MSGTFPSTPEPATATLTSDQPTFTSISESAKKQSRIAGGHLWKIKLSWASNVRSVFAPLHGFTMKQRGQYDQFQIVLPSHKTPLGVATGTPLVLSVGAVGSTLVFIKGFTGSTSPIMSAGDLIKFANHSKVYMVTDNAATDPSGNAAINIMPPLIEAIAVDEAVTVSDVPFTVSMDGDLLEWKGKAPNLVSFSLDLVESIL